MHTNGASRTSRPSLLATVATAVRGFGWLVDRLMGWAERARQRHTLMGLDDHLLKDIGISRVEAEREAAKPFWKE